MYKFTSIKCADCGEVIYNLPKTDANKLKGLKLECEDCQHKKYFKTFDLKQAVLFQS